MATKEFEPLAYTRGSASRASGIPPVTLDVALASGDLPFTKSGRRKIILREDLIDWLARCKERGEVPPRVPTAADRERMAMLNAKTKAKTQKAKRRKRGPALAKTEA